MAMIDPMLLMTAWLTGLAGSVHCLGMCGGIAGALSARRTGPQRWVHVAALHLGRAVGYGVAGGIAGLLGAGVARGLLGAQSGAMLRVLAATLTCAIGVQLTMGWRLLAPVERAGAFFWRGASALGAIAPSSRPGVFRALAMGVIWGWLPCGLVYAQLAVAATTGGPVQGSLQMIFFGLGTAVSLSALTAVFFSLGLGRLPQRASGGLLILFGLWMAWPVLRG
jgi:sulfite exporter TauE/SafE